MHRIDINIDIEKCAMHRIDIEKCAMHRIDIEKCAMHRIDIDIDIDIAAPVISVVTPGRTDLYWVCKLEDPFGQ